MSINEIYRNIILTFFIAIISLFIGLSILFEINRLMPIYIVPGSDLTYEQMKCELGLCDPIIVQYFRFIGNLFTGQWGISVSVVRNQPVINLIGETFLKTVGVVSLPLIIGGGLGVFLGRISSRNKGTWKDKTIQLFSILGISLPVFFLGMLFQYSLCYELRICEPWGISALPIEILTFTISALITWQARSYMINTSHEKSLISNTIKTGTIFSFIFMFYLLVEETFNIYGFGTILIDAFLLYDYFLIPACLFVIIIIFVIITVISNLIFSFYIFRTSESFDHKIESRLDDEVNKGNNSAENNPEESLKEYLLNRLKSPFGILGAILVIFFIFIAIFPQAITQYSLSETLSPSSGAWNPPSSEHPLGQTESGLDVLALIIWGIRDSIILGFEAVLIGLIGGSIFGFIAGKFNRWGYKLIMGLMIFFYIFPGIVLLMLLIYIYGPFYEMIMIMPTIGILLIPSFTRVIANAMSGEINIHKISKAVTSHIPLNFAIAIIIYTAIGFLGLISLESVLGLENQTIQLGSIVRMGVLLSEAPWASLWPGFAIFGIVLSFLLLHIGLQDYQPKSKVESN